MTGYESKRAAARDKLAAGDLYIDTHTLKLPDRSEWKCYLFGNTPQDNQGIVWVPIKGQEPNWFVRWMMRVCFACTWVKEKNT